ncbi:hypothetical protein FXO37_02315 [Capsicum annuum]|nr:hypothetical protein FXO37_02315 [Capsicum annuum]
MKEPLMAQSLRWPILESEDTLSKRILDMYCHHYGDYARWNPNHHPVMVYSNIASFLFHEPIGGSYIGSSSWVGLRSSEVDELDRDVEIGWCTLCGDVGSAVWIQANRWYVKDLELDFIASVKFGSKRDKLRKSICNNGLHAFLTKEQ